MGLESASTVVGATDVRTVVTTREILAGCRFPKHQVFGQFSLKRHGAGFGARKTASNPCYEGRYYLLFFALYYMTLVTSSSHMIS